MSNLSDFLPASGGSSLVYKREIFTVDGTWTKPAAFHGDYAFVTLIGGGSSGASSSLEQAGASGQYFIREAVDVSGTSSVTVTIGQGGASVNGAPSPGLPGTSTSFGALLTAAGGPAPRGTSGYTSSLNGSNPGSYENSSSYTHPIPGEFGVPTNSFNDDVNQPVGGSGLRVGPTLIKAGDAGSGASLGTGGVGYGAGGGGADNSQDSGAGAPGVLMVEWYEAV